MANQQALSNQDWSIYEHKASLWIDFGFIYTLEVIIGFVIHYFLGFFITKIFEALLALFSNYKMLILD